ncbi:hypothetical protein MIR68_007406 [Amoeboaphelidium protococcarum]|nr:hypothetical protein MIR68_007406 [Amoeboaphelidium protococcarum]
MLPSPDAGAGLSSPLSTLNPPPWSSVLFLITQCCIRCFLVGETGWGQATRAVRWAECLLSSGTESKRLLVRLAKLVGSSSLKDLIPFTEARRVSGGNDDWWMDACQFAVKLYVVEFVTSNRFANSGASLTHLIPGTRASGCCIRGWAGASQVGSPGD